MKFDIHLHGTIYKYNCDHQIEDLKHYVNDTYDQNQYFYNQNKYNPYNAIQEDCHIRNSIKLFIHNPCGDYRSKHLLVKKINIINFDIPRKKS